MFVRMGEYFKENRRTRNSEYRSKEPSFFSPSTLEIACSKFDIVTTVLKHEEYQPNG